MLDKENLDILITQKIDFYLINKNLKVLFIVGNNISDKTKSIFQEKNIKIFSTKSNDFKNVLYEITRIIDIFDI